MDSGPDDTLFPEALLERVVPDASVIEAAIRVGLHEEISNLPLGYETPVAQLGQNFSGGQLQRIALARAALKPASIIVLDEATSALDNGSEAIVTAYFDEIKATRVIVAHRLSTILDADIIYVMDDGRLVEQGTHQTLMQMNSVYRKLYSRSIDDDGRQARTTSPEADAAQVQLAMNGRKDD